MDLRRLTRRTSARTDAGNMHDHETGATLVEFALSSMIFLAVIFGVIEICMLFFAYNATSQVARATSRWAMVRGSKSCTNTPNLSHCNASTTDIANYAASLGLLNLQPSNVTVNYLSVSATQPATWSTCSAAPCNAPGNVVQVIISHPFATSIPFVSSLNWNPTSTSSVVITQ